MDFIVQNWSWVVTLLALTTVALIGITMGITQKLEDRHKQEFEQEFGESLKPIEEDQ